MIKTLTLSASIYLAIVANVYAANPPAVALSAANSPYTATTGGQFVAGCKKDESSCVAMIGNVLMDKIQFSPTSHICLPEITYGNAVAPWLAAHPETAGMNVEDAIFLAISTLYKCGPPNNY